VALDLVEIVRQALGKLSELPVVQTDGH
jgi:hypothetical protein